MRLLRPLTVLAVLALGAAAGAAATLVHQHWWGLLLGLAAGALVTLALPAQWWGRLAFTAGWLAMIVRLAWPRAEGDYLISANGLGYTLLGGSFGLLLVSLATLPRPGRRRGDPVLSPLDT